MTDQPPTSGTPDPTHPVARSTMSVEPARTMRSTAFDWDYEIRVALSASYGSDPERRYPVLWLTDGPQLIHLAIGLVDTLIFGGLVPELILVGVGCPSEAGVARRERRGRHEVS